MSDTINPRPAKELEAEIAKLAIEKNLWIEKALSSTNPEDIYKAQTYLQEQAKKQGSPKSWLLTPP